MQRPSAHIIRQGAADTIKGATPTVVSQSQPSASPPPVTPNPATARTRRLPIHDRSTPPGGWIDEAGAQHNADPALGTSVVAGATGASGFMIFKPSMMSVSSGAVIGQPGRKTLRRDARRPAHRFGPSSLADRAWIVRSTSDTISGPSHSAAPILRAVSRPWRSISNVVGTPGMARARDPLPDGST